MPCGSVSAFSIAAGQSEVNGTHRPLIHLSTVIASAGSLRGFPSVTGSIPACLKMSARSCILARVRSALLLSTPPFHISQYTCSLVASDSASEAAIVSRWRRCSERRSAAHSWRRSVAVWR